MESFEISTTLKATPQAVYDTWLSNGSHSAITGGAAASVSDVVGAEFEAWDGYITGTNLLLEPARRIVQAWRTAEFAPRDPDSRLEIKLLPVKGGTKLVLRHSEIPDGQGEEYKQGWEEHYFEHMREYFSNH